GIGDEPKATNAEQSGADPQMDCPKEWLESIRDDTGLIRAADNPKEFQAFSYFVQRARQYSLDDLTKRSRKELTHRPLYEEGRGKHRGAIVHVEGQLKRLVLINAKRMEIAGVAKLYEAWIFGTARPSNPTCVILSDLPPGVAVGGGIQKVRMSTDGY